MTARPAPIQIRCAIYTRVSTDAGLEQDFNSLDAQREACEAFIRSQSHRSAAILPVCPLRQKRSTQNLHRRAPHGRSA